MRHLVATLLARTRPGLPRATREFNRPPTWHGCVRAPRPWVVSQGTHWNYRCSVRSQQPAFGAECSESVLFSASATLAAAVEARCEFECYSGLRAGEASTIGQSQSLDSWPNSSSTLQPSLWAGPPNSRDASSRDLGRTTGLSRPIVEFRSSSSSLRGTGLRRNQAAFDLHFLSKN